MVPADVHPATLVLPKFGQPDLLSGRPPDGNFRFTYYTWMRPSAAFDDFVKQRGAKHGHVDVSLKPQQFSRVMAKIAHSYAVAQLGLRGFEPFLIDLIHGRDVQRAPEFVGGDPQTPPPAGDKVHELDLLPHPKFVVVRIRLFASSSIEGEHTMPVYIVVAGKRSRLRILLRTVTSFIEVVRQLFRRADRAVEAAQFAVDLGYEPPRSNAATFRRCRNSRS
jgi:hypothetical protein